jgi:hypothetical protein
VATVLIRISWKLVWNLVDPYFTSVLLYFSGPSGSLMPALFSVENWVTLKPVIGGVRDVALIHFPSCTDSIKPSLQFSCNFDVINASEGSLCFQNFLFCHVGLSLGILFFLISIYLMICKSSLSMGHLGSKTRSHCSNMENPC